MLKNQKFSGRWLKYNVKKLIRFNTAVRQITFDDVTDKFTVVSENLKMLMCQLMREGLLKANLVTDLYWYQLYHIGIAFYLDSSNK